MRVLLGRKRLYALCTGDMVIVRSWKLRCADAGVPPPDRRRDSTLGYGIHLLICLR